MKTTLKQPSTTSPEKVAEQQALSCPRGWGAAEIIRQHEEAMNPMTTLTPGSHRPKILFLFAGVAMVGALFAAAPAATLL